MNFKGQIEISYSEFLKEGFCENAQKLNDSIGKAYFDTKNPHFFTGKHDSKVVMIHLNPKRNLEQFGNETPFRSAEEYIEFFSNFGTNVYGSQTKRTQSSSFDIKQLRFFRALQVFNLKEERSESDQYENLEIIMNEKFQWELIPFGSPKFEFGKIPPEQLDLYINNCIDVISECSRDYILFCGSVFRNLLKQENVHILSKYDFRLTKKNGRISKNKYQVINIRISSVKHTIKAAILPQYTQYGIPLEAYAEKVREYYLQG